MKPYYEHQGITIYHGDAKELIKGLPTADIILTDPPYGISYQSARRTEWQRKDKIYGDDEFPQWIFGGIKFNVAMLVWCRWDQMKQLFPMPKSFIVWDKGNHSMGDLKHEFGRRWEGCAFYPGERHEFTKRPVDLIVANRINPIDLKHPNEKPITVFMPLIDSHVGELIIDPFCGSGSTLRAAKDLGRKAIGIEIEEKYCEIAAKRLSQEIFNFGDLSGGVAVSTDSNFKSWTVTSEWE